MAVADAHDANVWACLRQILGIRVAPVAAQVLATLALSHLQKGPAPCFYPVRDCRQRLEDSGFDMLSWGRVVHDPTRS